MPAIFNPYNRGLAIFRSTCRSFWFGAIDFSVSLGGISQFPRECANLQQLKANPVELDFGQSVGGTQITKLHGLL